MKLKLYFYLSDAAACILVAHAMAVHQGGLTIVMLLSFAAAWTTARIWLLSSDSSRSQSQPPNQVTVHELAARIENLVVRSQDLKVTAVQLTSFVHLLLYPESTRRRIKESMDLREPLITKSATAEITRDLTTAGGRDLQSRLGEDGGPLYVPIMRPLKKRLITGLSVVDKSGTSIATLSHEECLVFLTKVVVKLYADTFKAAPNHRDWTADQGAAFMSIMKVMLHIPSDAVEESSTRSTERNRVAEEFQSIIKALGLVAVDDNAQDRLIAVLRLLALNYVIIGQHPAEARFLVRYSYRVPKLPLHRQRKVGRFAHLKGWIRHLLRSDAAYLRIPINKAKRCDSYHLVITAPNGTHFARPVLKDASGHSVAKPARADFSIGNPYFRLSGPGYQEAHFYSRQLWKTPGSSYLDVRIQETPPGRLGRAALVAGFILPLIYLVGRAAQVKTSNELNLDHAAILAAGVPTALAILGFVLGTTAADSRVVAILAVPSAVVSALVVLVSATQLMSPSTVSPQDQASASIDFFGVYAHDWLALCLVATLNLLVTTFALAVRLIRHDLLRRRAAAALDVETVISR